MAEDTKAIGSPTTLSCPDCGGGLSEIRDGPVLRFRCQVGHAFSPDSMEEAQAEAMEKALWVALRTHEDRVRRLREAGVEEAAIARISSPIGLDLGARTPEETAVAIAAEIIATRWRDSGRRLTQTRSAIHHPIPEPSPR